MRGAVVFPEDLVDDVKRTYETYGDEEASDEDLCGIKIMTREEIQNDDHALEIAEVDFPPREGHEKRSAVLAIWWGWTAEEYFTGRSRNKGASPDAEGTPVPLPPPPPATETSANATPPLPPPSPSRHSRHWSAADDFLRLAERLGSHLTQDIRCDLVSDERWPAGPTALWCLLLFTDFADRAGIPQEDLDKMNDGRMRPHARPWDQPFLGSLELIERLQAEKGKSEMVSEINEGLETSTKPGGESGTRQKAGGTGKPKKPGPKLRPERVKEDKRIAEAWATKRYKTHEECARAFCMTEDEVRKALDRVRTNRKRALKSEKSLD